MITFRAFLTDGDDTSTLMGLRDDGLATKKLNEGVTVALKAGAELWVKTYLPRHFEKYAGAKYRYRSRGNRYNAGKTTKRYLNVWRRNPITKQGEFMGGIAVPNPNFGLEKPLDWVYTGALRAHVLENARSGHLLQQAKAPFAAKRIRLEMPIGFPHPVPREYTGAGGNPEIVMITPGEAKEMSGVARQAFVDWMLANPGKYKGTKVAKRRAERRFIKDVVAKAF